MGARKKLRADKIKEARKSICQVKLNNVPTSPRKMRLMADNIRGLEVFKALAILQNSPQDAAKRLETLVRSGIASWEAKNEGQTAGETALAIQEIFVDSGRMLKRIQPAPQGRAHRIRKRSNHVTLIVGANS
jgi:large subunit ribosomal protein L22|tara:strand:- start:16088 stop:16483 length:396 start_codon:yes stop_codon:yes gene_type:complete